MTRSLTISEMPSTKPLCFFLPWSYLSHCCQVLILVRILSQGRWLHTGAIWEEAEGLPPNLGIFIPLHKTSPLLACEMQEAPGRSYRMVNHWCESFLPMAGGRGQYGGYTGNAEWKETEGWGCLLCRDLGLWGRWTQSGCWLG